MDNSIHEQYMTRCLELASLGLGNVAPNPLVGSVIVHEGTIIGEGYHQEFGREHAEVNTIHSVKKKELLKQATLYVNLEPCSHHGKTPPCADLIIQSNIPKVVIGTQDPFAKVNGQGIKRLKDAGIEVTVNILNEECLELNKRFFCFHEKKRPYIILKWAQTANGYMAGTANDPQYISGKEALTMVHKWRAEEDAFMVGTNTVKVDNPNLTNRLWKGHNPLRVTIDRYMNFDPKLNLLNKEADTLIFNQVRDLKQDNIEWVKSDMEFNFANDFCKILHERQIQSIVIEGGKILLSYFIDKGLWDEVRILSSKETTFKMGLKAPKIEARLRSQQELDKDTIYYLSK